jgi:DNA-binding IclR family transcriptional regulator
MNHLQALAFIAERNGRVGVFDLAEHFMLTPTAAVRLMCDLVRGGALRHVGPLLGGRWEVVAQLDAWAPTQPMEANEPDRT